MYLYLNAFIQGVKSGLQKQAGVDMGSMPINENILPNITSQAKWRYVRTNNGLRLTDGNTVYTFGIPSEYPSESFRVARLNDENVLDFENDALSKGTAQIHRAAPDNIYLTLADGADNPTFALQHESEKQWRYTPSKKFVEKLRARGITPLEEKASAEPSSTQANENVVLINPESLMAGGTDEMKNTFETPSKEKTL
jgi:hypothetical protein